MGVKTHYLHSEVETLERVEILRDLRLGVYDVVVGINLLREGLDLPEVSLVAILDADKEGYLRSKEALIQTMGRAARHIDGHVIMYADTITRLHERGHRGDKAPPQDPGRPIIRNTASRRRASRRPSRTSPSGSKWWLRHVPPYDVATPATKEDLARLIKELESQMKTAARNLEFEKAALFRDRLVELRRSQIEEEQEVVKKAGRHA